MFFKFNGDDEKYKSKYVNEGANSDSWFISSLENSSLFKSIIFFQNFDFFPLNTNLFSATPAISSSFIWLSLLKVSFEKYNSIL